MVVAGIAVALSQGVGEGGTGRSIGLVSKSAPNGSSSTEGAAVAVAGVGAT